MYTIEFYYATQFNLDNSGNLNFKYVPVLGSDGTYKLDGRIKTLTTACHKALERKESLSSVRPSIAAYRILNNATERYETHYITFEDMWLFYEKHVNPKNV